MVKDSNITGIAPYNGNEAIKGINALPTSANATMTIMATKNPLNNRSAAGRVGLSSLSPILPKRRSITCQMNAFALPSIGPVIMPITTHSNIAAIAVGILSASKKVACQFSKKSTMLLLNMNKTHFSRLRRSIMCLYPRYKFVHLHKNLLSQA